MAQAPSGYTQWLLLKTLLLQSCLVALVAEERRECREQEYRDQYENCVTCRQCEAGQELSKECGFGFGGDARCVPCRASRFKEDRGLHKCKPCVLCPLLHRLQKANCSSTRNGVCGDCLPGFYRRTKLSGFQDVECIPCGDPPPPYEPHCVGRVNLVPMASTVSSPRDVALAAVICSALATVLLALCILCVIYCKRQLLEKKPASLRCPDGPYSGEELSCLDRRRSLDASPRPCSHCHHTAEPPCGPVHLIPSLCCEDLQHPGRGHDCTAFLSQRSHSDRDVASVASGSRDDGEAFSEAWPLVAAAADTGLKEDDDDEERLDSGLLHTQAGPVIAPDRDDTLLGRHHAAVASVCP